MSLSQALMALAGVALFLSLVHAAIATGSTAPKQSLVWASERAYFCALATAALTALAIANTLVRG